jgi:hypothetical protein
MSRILTGKDPVLSISSIPFFSKDFKFIAYLNIDKIKCNKIYVSYSGVDIGEYSLIVYDRLQDQIKTDTFIKIGAFKFEDKIDEIQNKLPEAISEIVNKTILDNKFNNYSYEIDPTVYKTLNSKIVFGTVTKNMDLILKNQTEQQELINLLSIIDMKNCVEFIKSNRYNSTSSNDSIIYIKLEYNHTDSNFNNNFQSDYDNFLSNTVNLNLFDFKGNLIDLSICKDISILFSLPIHNHQVFNYTLAKEFENNQKINIYDKNDPIYNDICNPYYDQFSDWSLNQRRSKLFQNFSIICSNNCTYKGIDQLPLRENYALCECKGTNFNLNGVSLLYSNKPYDKIEQNNLSVLACYKKLMDVIGLVSNYGYMIISGGIFLSAIVSIVLGLLHNPIKKENLVGILKVDSVGKRLLNNVNANQVNPRPEENFILQNSQNFQEENNINSLREIVIPKEVGQPPKDNFQFSDDSSSFQNAEKMILKENQKNFNQDDEIKWNDEEDHSNVLKNINHKLNLNEAKSHIKITEHEPWELNINNSNHLNSEINKIITPKINNNFIWSDDIKSEFSGNSRQPVKDSQDFGSAIPIGATDRNSINELISNKDFMNSHHSYREYSQMNFKQSLECDQRRFSEMYWDMIKNNHIVLSIFLCKSLYIPKYLQVHLLSSMLIFNLSLNCIFFTEKDLDYRLTNQQVINEEFFYVLQYEIVKSVISTLISSAIISFLFLLLTRPERAIQEEVNKVLLTEDINQINST